jgi:hypothetical protein
MCFGLRTHALVVEGRGVDIAESGLPLPAAYGRLEEGIC